MRVADFDFELPEECIALRPVEPRDKAQLLLVRPNEAPVLNDCRVGQIADFLNPNDVLVFNDTRVIHARLTGWREREGASGCTVDVTLHQRLSPSRWAAFLRPGKRIKPGDFIRFGGKGEACYATTLDATVMDKGEAGEVVLEFSFHGPILDEAIANNGFMPLPPYIAGKRQVDEQDESDYQTVYARHDGAVAAPTAGLHFTTELLVALKERGIQQEFVTLHVGAGTFLPVKAEEIEKHKMHSEIGEVSSAVAARLNEVKAAGGRIIAIGTTALRLLESAVDEHGKIQAYSDVTDIFITPGFKFRACDALFTNFHLPRSTLFMLVSAFSGLETMQDAYSHAIKNDYRFYSYGDASLLFPKAQ